MTAQDIDLQEFSSDDLRALRARIDSLPSKQTASKVRRLVNFNCLNICYLK
jgi:hypothetical protein